MGSVVKSLVHSLAFLGRASSDPSLKPWLETEPVLGNHGAESCIDLLSSHPLSAVLGEQITQLPPFHNSLKTKKRDECCLPSAALWDGTICGLSGDDRATQMNRSNCVVIFSCLLYSWPALLHSLRWPLKKHICRQAGPDQKLTGSHSVAHVTPPERWLLSCQSTFPQHFIQSQNGFVFPD